MKDLSAHRVYADNSIHISAHQFTYNWDWDTTIAKLGTDPARLAKFADNLRATSGPLHLRDVLAYSDELNRHQQDLDRQAQNVNTTLRSHFSLVQTLLTQLSSGTVPFALSSSALALFAVLVPVAGVVFFRFRSDMNGTSTALHRLVTRIPDVRQLLLDTNARTLYPSLKPLFDDLVKFQDHAQTIMALIPTPADNNDNNLAITHATAPPV